MEQSEEELLNKLIILFVMDKMDIGLTESSIVKICYEENGWIKQPLICNDTVNRLVASKLILKVRQGREKDCLCTLTPDGRTCLANFYTRIPESLRQDISEFVKVNRMDYKRKQVYKHTYFKNSDGTYTVQLKIVEPAVTVLNLELNVANNKTAKYIHQNWEKMAASFYMNLLEQLTE